MENIIKALSTNFDLLDFLYVHYKIPNKKDDNFFFNAEYIENNKIDDVCDIDLEQSGLDWNALSYNYSIPWSEDLIDSQYDKLNWCGISSNPKIKWDERLLNKYWDKIWLGCIISYSPMFWDEKLVRFTLSKVDEESTKIFWLEKFSIITNISWNLQMIIDFPTTYESQTGLGDRIHKSYWIREVVEAKTLELSFEDLKKHKEQLNKELFKYLQVSDDLFWTYQAIIEFKELIDFKTLSKCKNVNWSNEIIISFYEKLDFELMSKNESIPIDEFIIKKYKNRWNFKSLSSNSNVKWNLELLKAFISEFDLNMVLQFSISGVDENFINDYRDKINWGSGCGSYTYNPAPIARYKHIPISVHTLIENATKWEVGDYVKPYWDEKGATIGEWHQFSSNQFLTKLHLETFADKLSWDVISSNEHLQISSDLLIKFSDRWNWQKLLNRKDFKLEHFYAIHQYLNFEILNACCFKIFEILEHEKNRIFTYIKDDVEIAGNFRYALRTPNSRPDNEYYDGMKLIAKAKKAFLVEQCERATRKLAEINSNRNEDERRYYDRIHNWLREYFKVFDEISYVSDSLERKRISSEREIFSFFVSYLKSEKDFKKNYFDVYK